MKRVSLPVLNTNKDINNLNYPEDIEVGLYVWDENMRRPILITDSSSVEIHQTSLSSSRTRFATLEEIRKERERDKFPFVTYNTVIKWRAYNYARVIYTLAT